MREATIPPAALRDSDSREMLRAWIAENGLHCTVHVGMWEEAGSSREEHSWGILLADVIRHISSAMSERYGDPPERTRETIARALLEELRLPTSAANGAFLDQ